MQDIEFRPHDDPSVESPRTSVIAECQRVHTTSGLMAALRYLNARTRFRYTGVYHADPPTLLNIVLFDRENPSLNVSGARTALGETYCALTWESGQPFLTSDSRVDSRLRAHVARDSVISYAGVPITLASGRVWGSLCHFDARPRLLPAHELQVLESISPLMKSWLELE